MVLWGGIGRQDGLLAQGEDASGEDLGDLLEALLRGKKMLVVAGAHGYLSEFGGKPTAACAWRLAGCLAGMDLL